MKGANLTAKETIVNIAEYKLGGIEYVEWIIESFKMEK